MPQKTPRPSPQTIRLPRGEEELLAQEMKSTGRSRTGIIVEALQIRRAALEVLGSERARPQTVAEVVAEQLKAGLKRR